MLLLSLFVLLAPLPYLEAHPVVPSYVVYMPTTMNPTLNYNIYMWTFDTYGTVQVTAFVDNNPVSLSGFSSITLYPGIPRLTFINPASIARNNSHIIRIVGKQNNVVKFSKTRTVFETNPLHQTNKQIIFIQMDKECYKPLDVVRFGCVGIDSELNINHGQLNVYLFDSKNNLLHIWSNQTSTTGVIKYEFQLSDKPNLGRWKLKLEQPQLNISSEKFFYVSKHVLPPIKVEISGDKFISHLGHPAFYLSMCYIDIFVRAKYSFGGPVKGILVLRITINSSPKISIEKTYKIKGYKKVRFYLRDFFKKKDAAIVHNYSRMKSYITLKVVATVIEKETEYNGISNPWYVSIVKAPIRMKVPNVFTIKPGFCNKILIRISRRDGKPLTIGDVERKLNVTWIGKKLRRFELVCIPLDGIVHLEITNTNYNRVKIRYYSQYQKGPYVLVRTIYIKKFSTPEFYQLKASLKKNVCYANDNIRILVESTAILRKVYYLVVQNGVFISSGYVNAVGNSVLVIFKTSATWIPFVKIVFTAITNHGLILVDVLPLKIRTDYKYQVSGMFSPSVNRAGRFTTLQMMAVPKATLYIMSVERPLSMEEPEDHYSMENIVKRNFDLDLNPNVPVYIHNIPRLLSWAGVKWISNKIEVTKDGKTRWKKVAEKRKRGEIKQRSSDKVREDFPKVWIWKEVITDSNGMVRLSFKTPGSITNWITYAVAVHKKYGVSVIEKPIRFFSFQEMLLTLDLPYSVIRFEKLGIKVIVYNYLTRRQKVLVALTNRRLIFRDRPSKTIIVKAKDYASVTFRIRPKVIGNIPIHINLLKRNKRKYVLVDSIKKSLRVKLEGITQYFNKEYQLNWKWRRYTIQTIRVPIPRRGVVPGSERIEVCVTGDIMGPTIAGLKKLVRLPTGCGEQIAIKLVPNIVIYKYLAQKKALSNELKAKLIKYTSAGYQNQIKYLKKDGSYSAFLPDKGSVWLTAYIACALQEVIDSGMNVVIDKSKIKKSLKWLLGKQRPNGQFIETGDVIHQSMQGGATNNNALTAYVLVTLIKLKKYHLMATKKAIKKATKYLKKLNLKKQNVYTLCIIFYAYSELKHWKYFKKVRKILETKDKKNSFYKYWPGRHAIEQTSYCLLAFTNRAIRKKKILSWLLSKRNSLGGFSDTQATVVALRALTKRGAKLKTTNRATVRLFHKNKVFHKFKKILKRNLYHIQKKKVSHFYLRALRALKKLAAKLKATNGAIVSLFHKNKSFHRFNKITKRNLYHIQKKKLPKDFRRFKVLAQGVGPVYISVSWQYNVFKKPNKPYGLSVEISVKKAKFLVLMICLVWKKKRASGMIVNKVKIPSGYEVKDITCSRTSCPDPLKCKRTYNCLSKREADKDDVNLYQKRLRRKKAIWIIIIFRKKYAVTNRNVSSFIETISYYDGMSVVTPFSPFMGGNS